MFAIAFVLGAEPVSAECLKTFVSGQKNPLEGNWLFYKGNPPQASAFDAPESGWREAPVPGVWKNNPALKSYEGDVWYRCRVRLEGPAEEGLGLLLGVLQDADAVFFNGEQVGQTGSFSPPRADVEKPRLYSLPANLWRQGENVIAIHLRGSSSASGIYDVPEIVNESQAARRLFLRDVTAIVFSCIYMLVASFFGLFFVYFPRQRDNLYFALFSLLLGVYHLIRTWMRYVLFKSFETSYSVELITLFVLPPIFLNFLIHLIRIKRPTVVLVVQILYAPLIIVTIFANRPALWSNVINANLVLLVISIALTTWIVWKNYAEHRDKLKYIFIGVLCLTPALFNDILVTLRIINTPRITVYAFLLFLGFVSLQLSDSVLALYHSLQEQEKDLRLVEKKKTSSIFNIANEFRTIFDGIKDGLDAISNGGAKSGKRKAVADPESTIRASIANLENLLNDSNLLYMLESGDYMIRRVRFSIRKMSQQVIDRALAATRQGRKRLLLDLPEEEVEIIGDPDLISTGLYHLVENALLYTTGQVEVSVEKTGNQLVCQVRDEGPGLTTDQQKIIFEKFIRAVDESSEIQGSGIGLTIVNHIAFRLDGTLKLESGAGFFSTFALRIPLAAENVPV